MSISYGKNSDAAWRRMYDHAARCSICHSAIEMYEGCGRGKVFYKAYIEAKRKDCIARWNYGKLSESSQAI